MSGFPHRQTVRVPIHTDWQGSHTDRLSGFPYRLSSDRLSGLPHRQADWQGTHTHRLSGLPYTVIRVIMFIRAIRLTVLLGY